MFLFKRIFDFDQKAAIKLEQRRLNTRYAPGAGFPLQGWLVLGGREWPAKVADLSGNGVGLLVAAAAKPEPGQPVRVRLSIGDHQQVLDGRLVQVRAELKGLHCGVGIAFSDFPTQKTYLQLLQPVAIGRSLQAVAGDRVVQNEPQFIKQVFRGEDDAVLTVWLEKTAGTPLHSFEFQLHNYFCHAEAKAGTLEAYTRESSDTHKGTVSQPVIDSSPALHAEIRQLFRWILPNLSSAVPDDVRAVLQRFGA